MQRQAQLDGSEIKIFSLFVDTSSFLSTFPATGMDLFPLMLREGKLPAMHLLSWEGSGLGELNLSHAELSALGLSIELPLNGEVINAVCFTM